MYYCLASRLAIGRDIDLFKFLKKLFSEDSPSYKSSENILEYLESMYHYLPSFNNKLPVKLKFANIEVLTNEEIIFFNKLLQDTLDANLKGVYKINNSSPTYFQYSVSFDYADGGMVVGKIRLRDGITKYAVKKPSALRAAKIFDTKAEAISFCETHVGYDIENRYYGDFSKFITYINKRDEGCTKNFKHPSESLEYIKRWITYIKKTIREDKDFYNNYLK